MKKLLLAACSLMLAVGLAGCSLNLSELPNVRDAILGEQTAEPEPAAEATEPEEEETLEEAAKHAEKTEEPVETKEPVPEEETTPQPEPVALTDKLAADAPQVMDGVRARFLRYIAVDTTTEPTGDTVPSTENQLMLAREITAELQTFGMEAAVDDYGYVYGTIPATAEGQPVIGFIGHLDTDSEVSAASVRPNTVEAYDGGDIALDEAGQVVLSAAEFPQLAEFAGDELVITDGMTALGADGKAGVAEIVALCDYLCAHPEIPHGTVKIALIPDSELGQGADYFDVPGFGANFAYVMNGETLADGVQYETYNEADAVITVTGDHSRTGNKRVKGKNAALIAAQFASMLPTDQDSERGMYEVKETSGTMQQAKIQLTVRDYDQTQFNSRRTMLTTIANYLNASYGEGTVQVVETVKGYNMSGMIQENLAVVDRALEALKAENLEPNISPCTYFTDCAGLTFKGLPCPNLPTGAANGQSVYECVSVNQMTDVVKVMVHIVCPEEMIVPPTPEPAAEELTEAGEAAAQPEAATQEAAPAEKEQPTEAVKENTANTAAKPAAPATENAKKAPTKETKPETKPAAPAKQ